MSDCLCLKCYRRFSCDFALSVWAAKARMMDMEKHVSMITIECNDFAPMIVGGEQSS